MAATVPFAVAGTGIGSDLEQLCTAACRLPLCDDAAKLHALVARLLEAVHTGGNVAAVADALTSAASAALEHDPWVQFEIAARAFAERAASPALTAADSAQPDSSRLVSPQTT
jgi:hypothetical protein